MALTPVAVMPRIPGRYDTPEGSRALSPTNDAPAAVPVPLSNAPCDASDASTPAVPAAGCRDRGGLLCGRQVGHGAEDCGSMAKLLFVHHCTS